MFNRTSGQLETVTPPDLGKGKKNPANYRHFVDKRLIPATLSLLAKVNNIHNKDFGAPPPCPHPLLSKFIIFFLLLLFNLFRFFSLIVVARYRLNTTKYVIKEPQKTSKSS